MKEGIQSGSQELRKGKSGRNENLELRNSGRERIRKP